MLSADPSLKWKCDSCGKKHSTQGTYTRHIRQCKPELKRSFDEQHYVREAKKRQRLHHDVEQAPVPGTPTFIEPSAFIEPSISFPGRTVTQDASSRNPHLHPLPGPQPVPQPVTDLHDLDTPVAVRKSSRVSVLPSKFSDFVSSQPKRVQKTKDVFPESLTGLPMEPTSSLSPGPSVTDADPAPPPYVQSTANGFGLFRKYHSSTFPAHDPDVGAEDDSFVDSCNSSHTTHSQTIPPELFHPYPNMSAFLLGRWQHNAKHSKSMRQFSDLLEVLRNPNFRLSEIRGVNFQRIAEKLASLEVCVNITHRLRTEH